MTLCMALSLCVSVVSLFVRSLIALVPLPHSLIPYDVFSKMIADHFVDLLSRPAGSPNLLPRRISPSDLPQIIKCSGASCGTTSVATSVATSFTTSSSTMPPGAASGAALFVDDPWRSWASFVRKIKGGACADANKYCARGFDRICDPTTGKGIPFFEFR